MDPELDSRQSVAFPRVLAPLLALLVSLAAILVVARYPHSILAGDPAAYRLRIAEILRSGWPYVEVPYEHLPVMLVPMASAWYLGGAGSQPVYILVFAVLMAATLSVTAYLMGVLGSKLGINSGSRWVALFIPLAPLAVFRNDPVAVVLLVAGALQWVKNRQSWWIWAIGGAFAKVWPSVLAVAGWRRSRWRSLMVALGGLLAIGWTLLPGFVAARQAVGIHAETPVGALVVLTRILRRQASGITITTAAYVDIGAWAVVVSSMIGFFVLGLGLWALRESAGARRVLLGAGVLVLGLILGSSLLSLQYALWITPFLALSTRRSTLLLGLLLGALSTGIAGVWEPARLEQSWFYVVVTLRNLLLIVLAVSLARESRLTPQGDERV